MTENIPPIPPRTPLNPRKRALLIGASSGIGAALARRLACEGYTVACLARREEVLNALCDEINSASGENRAIPYVHDVADYEAVPALLQQILTDLGTLDLVIFNAGILNTPKLDEYNFEHDRAMMEVNAIGAMAWLDPIAAMFHQLKCGQIVGIGSVAGDRGRVGNPGYNTSKAALHTYLEALRNRLTRRGVNVLTVKPGFVNTDMVKASPKVFWLISPEQAADSIWKAIRDRKQMVYVPGQWSLLMLVIRHIPSFIFRKLSF